MPVRVTVAPDAAVAEVTVRVSPVSGSVSLASTAMEIAAPFSDADADVDLDDHGDGWSQPGQHGLAAKVQDSECGTCHGGDLLGGEDQRGVIVRWGLPAAEVVPEDCP